MKTSKSEFPKYSSLIPNFFSIRTLILIIIYSFLIGISFIFSYLLRFEFQIPDQFKPLMYSTLIWLIPFKLMFFAIFGQFSVILRYFHIPSLMRIFFSTFSSSIILLFLYFIYRSDDVSFIPRSIIMADFFILSALVCAFRLSIRLHAEKSTKDENPHQKVRTVIIGAGESGASICSELLSKKKNTGVIPVLFLDDDKKKIGKQVNGILVRKLPENFDELIEKYDLKKAIIAIPSASGKKIKQIIDSLKKSDIETNIVPSLNELSDGKVEVSRIRKVKLEDILGREPAVLDDDKIDEIISGKVVLVTGAGGSIGSELCKQIARRKPQRLILIEHCEVQIFQIEQDLINGNYPAKIKPIVASIADEKMMELVFENYKPQIVFHAAAHKHVPMMESQPMVALKNNSIGTFSLAKIASKYKVEKFILISTDKAINPTNAMGASKRLAEIFVQSMQGYPENQTSFACVRFGNVLGSSGSMIPTFKKQIARGGPVSVTHSDVTRYFMTIPEAVGLVLQCGTLSKGGEIFVLNMGEPIKIIDIARTLIELSGFKPDIDIDIKIVGLRPGEKLYEELQHTNEHLAKTKHERIFIFESDKPSLETSKEIEATLISLLYNNDANFIKRAISKLIPEYKPYFD